MCVYARECARVCVYAREGVFVRVTVYIRACAYDAEAIFCMLFKSDKNQISGKQCK